jgi:hypothetical protein
MPHPSDEATGKPQIAMTRYTMCWFSHRTSNDAGDRPD